MLVLISFGLVLVATVLLVLGLVQDSGLALIYVSIACSLAAGIILVIATRVNRPRSESAVAGTGAASRPPVDEPAVGATPEVVVTPAPAPAPAPEPETVAAAPAATEVGSAAAAESFAPVTGSVSVVTSEDDELFPIADYDDLSVGEIVPLLPKLYADEIDVVEQRERAGKNRSEILDRLARLRVEFEGAPDDVTAEEWASQRGVELAPPAPAPSARKRAAGATKKVVVPAPPKKAAKKAVAPVEKAAVPAPPKKAAKKAAAPVEKAAAPGKKAAAPAKKAAAPAKKAAAPAKKAAAPAKKAAPTEETAAQAAAPAKDTAKKTATKATKATKKA